jgi:hypothetical protein
VITIIKGECLEFTADVGKKLEAELNGVGPGESMFIKCDVTKEEQLKVCVYSIARLVHIPTANGYTYLVKMIFVFFLCL